MKTVRIELKNAERLRKYLLSNDLLSKDYKAKKSSDHIYFPIVDEDDISVKFPTCKITDKKLEKIEKVQDYKELVDEDPDKLPSSYDIIGDIIIVEIDQEAIHKEKEIADALLNTHNSVKTVLKKSGIHSGEFRTQKLKHLAGKKKKETVYKENDTKIKIDVEKVYFSSRLSTERKRIYRQVRPGENILVMFSGSGIYPLVISRNTEAKKITGIEKNPLAHKYAVENKKLNKTKNVEFYKGDVRDIVPKLDEKFDRIIMPLPKDADTFLDLVPSAAKEGTIVHLYGFSHRDEMDETANSVRKFCKENNVECKIKRTVKCGQYSPCKYRVCVDFIIG